MNLCKVVVSLATLALGLAPVAGQAAGGDAIFKKSCASCHYTDGPAKEKTIADQLAKKGPELWYAGSKFQKAWLAEWLQKPTPIRPLKYNSLSAKNAGDHPKSSAADAAALTDYLMTLTSPEVKAGTIQAKESVQGRAIFTKKMPCTGCHTFPMKGQNQGGLSGPSLVGAGKRLNPDWIYAYLAKTKTFKPVRDMPDFAGPLNPKDLENVAAYVATF
ncbi:cytochrome c oxidase cbb3-type subunit III [Burkholderiales bacterium]|nr:cytochrome c oxidase cbb3-type subunit III [Burkholderiales bacterium]